MPPLENEETSDEGGVKEKVRVSERLSNVEQGLRDLGKGVSELGAKTQETNFQLGQLVELAKKDDKRKEDELAWRKQQELDSKTWVRRQVERLFDPRIVGTGGIIASIVSWVVGRYFSQGSEP